jgi:hypothetical protein
MKTFFNSDRLRAVEYFRNTVPKNEIQCKKKRNTVQKNEIQCKKMKYSAKRKEIQCKFH